MTLFAFREAKSHEWTFCDPIKIGSVKHGHASQNENMDSFP